MMWLCSALITTVAIFRVSLSSSVKPNCSRLFPPHNFKRMLLHLYILHCKQFGFSQLRLYISQCNFYISQMQLLFCNFLSSKVIFRSIAFYLVIATFYLVRQLGFFQLHLYISQSDLFLVIANLSKKVTLFFELVSLSHNVTLTRQLFFCSCDFLNVTLSCKLTLFLVIVTLCCNATLFLLIVLGDFLVIATL